MDDVIETLMSACGTVGIRPRQVFHDVHEFKAHVLQTFPLFDETDKDRALDLLSQSVREAEARRVVGVVVCVKRIAELAAKKPTAHRN